MPWRDLSELDHDAVSDEIEFSIPAPDGHQKRWLNVRAYHAGGGVYKDIARHVVVHHAGEDDLPQATHWRHVSDSPLHQPDDQTIEATAL